VRSHGPRPDVNVGGVSATEHPLRAGLEHAYRQLAEMTDDRHERVRLVDRANRVRPRTMV
jgi:serine/threonine-protein kinase PknG